MFKFYKFYLVNVKLCLFCNTHIFFLTTKIKFLSTIQRIKHHFKFQCWSHKAYPRTTMSIRSKLFSRYWEAISCELTRCLCKFAITWVAFWRAYIWMQKQTIRLDRKPWNEEMILIRLTFLRERWCIWAWGSCFF